MHNNYIYIYIYIYESYVTNRYIKYNKLKLCIINYLQNFNL